MIELIRYRLANQISIDNKNEFGKGGQLLIVKEKMTYVTVDFLEPNIVFSHYFNQPFEQGTIRNAKVYYRKG